MKQDRAAVRLAAPSRRVTLAWPGAGVTVFRMPITLDAAAAVHSNFLGGGDIARREERVITLAVAALASGENTMRILVFASASLVGTLAFAQDPVTLPPTAKLLTKAEIIAAYGGKPHTWSHPNTDKGTGTFTLDANTSTVSGTWEIGKQKGEFEGKITYEGDQSCYRTRPKGSKKAYGKITCNLVYLDGDTAYEVNPKTKVITSVNKPM